MTATQTWCARCAWPGRKPFLVGTFTTDARAGHEVARNAAIAEWRETMADILPLDASPPELLALIPGAITFQPEGDQP